MRSPLHTCYSRTVIPDVLCNSQPLVMIHKDDSLPNSIEIVPGVYWGGKLLTLAKFPSLQVFATSSCSK